MATDLNVASERELRRLPGVGETIAKRIVAARPFVTLQQLQQIHGIGTKRYLALVSDCLVTIGAVDDDDDKKDDVKEESPAPSVKKERSAHRTCPTTPALVDLNRATLQELQNLHGIGAKLAQRIIDARPFRRKNEITAVRGIGLITYEKMQHQLLEIRSTSTPEDDDSDKENEPQAASPTRTSRSEPSMSPRDSNTREYRCFTRLWDVPSRHLLGDIRGSVLPQTTSKLLIASWNIRNLSRKRDAEPLHRITDVLQQFDVIAMQEVRDTIVLRRLKQFMPGWDYIASPLVGYTGSTTQWRRRAEHFAYFYRRRVIAPVEAEIATGTDMVRPPYVATFQTLGTTTVPLTFTLVNTHIVCGDNASRQEEMNEVWRLMTRLESEKTHGHRNFMLLGDFNLAPQDMDNMGEGDQTYEPVILSPLSTTVGDKLLDNIWLSNRGEWETLALESGVYRIDWALYPHSRGVPRQYATQNTRIGAHTARVRCTLELSDHCPVYVALGEM